MNSPERASWAGSAGPDAKKTTPERASWAGKAGPEARKGAQALRRRRPYTAQKAFKRLLRRCQGGRCGICFRPMPSDVDRLSIDHVVPISRGGADGLGNLVAAHKGCNRAKGSHPPTLAQRAFCVLVTIRVLMTTGWR